MSSRALRRIERERLQNSASPEVRSESSDSEPERTSKAVNAFALLGDESSENDSDGEKYVAPPVEEVPHNLTTPKKLKKAKKKAAKRAKKTEIVSEDEDLDKFLEEVRMKDLANSRSQLAVVLQEDLTEEPDFERTYDEQEPPITYADSNFLYFTTSRLKQCLPLLSIGSVKNLDPDTELKNLFGNLSLETIEDANSTTSLPTSPEVLAQIKKLAKLTRWGGKDRRSIPGTTRKLLLTRIKDDWVPTTQRPLNMEELRKEDIVQNFYYKEEDATYENLERKVQNEAKLGVKYFRFTKLSSPTEKVANSRFYASVVMTPDPESLMQLLQQHPYHVESLLQVAMVMLRQGNNKATSNALVEKCLFVFDRSLHKKFHELLQDGKTGLVRLPYEGYVNRQLYLCIFRAITGLGERNTFFTALCYCKLLLAFSPAEDPVGVRYFIDHYAILSEEYEYLVSFVQSPLTQTYSQWYTPGLAFSEVLALLHLERFEEARSSLQRALLVHPYCAYHLLENVGLASHIPVLLSDLHTDENIVLASETYLVRAPLLWKDQAHRQFLHDELLTLFKKSAKRSSWLGKWFGSAKDECELSVNLVRFAILSGENKVLAKAPERLFERDDIYEYDVIPPKDETSGYDVYTGVQDSGRATDSLFDYIDHNIIGAIVQNRTEAEFDDLLADFGAEEEQ